MQKKLLTSLVFACVTISFVSAHELDQKLQNLADGLNKATKFLDQVEKTETHINLIDFEKWKKLCDLLPNYNDNKANNPPSETSLVAEIYTKTFETFFNVIQKRLKNVSKWLNSKMPDTQPWSQDNVIDTKNSTISKNQTIPFVPFIEKIIVKPTDKIALHGDFHGDVHACNMFIQTWIDAGYMDINFNIIKNDFYIIFLGDYTDRGWYGAEVIYTILRLKIANPHKVFMVRGNHEDFNIIHYYGFVNELSRKFKHEEAATLLGKITRFYNFLPMAVYLMCPSNYGFNIIQCCHGGIELGYNPRMFLESPDAQFEYVPKLKPKNQFVLIENVAPKNIRHILVNDNTNETNGFMWSDFSTDLTGTMEQSQRGAGFVYGQSVTQELLKQWSSLKYTLRAIFRAHQHQSSNADPMKQIILNFNKTRKNELLTASWYKAPKEDAGIAFLWSTSDAKQVGKLQNILALTFSVAPGTPYDWPYDAFGLLTVARDYDDWNIKVYTKARAEYEK